jgi:DNA ligase-1
MSVYWINKLNEDGGRLHKEAAIQDALNMANLGESHSAMFLTLANFAYNPFITFGVKQVPTTDGIIDAENPWTEFISLLSNLRVRSLTGHAARDAVEAMSQRFDSAEWNGLCRPTIMKDLRAGISEKTINKIVKKTAYEIPTFGCQLASSCEGRPEMRGLKRLEPKLDGVRALFVVDISNTGSSVTCYSRNGKVFENFDHICDQISTGIKPLVANLSKHIGTNVLNGFVLDGEVIGKSFNDLMKQARRKTDVQADDSTLFVFDVIPLSEFLEGHCNAQLSKRIKAIEECRSVFDTMNNVDLLTHIMVDLDTAAGRDQFERYCADKVAEGFEGAMVKNLDAPYECRRNTSWLKYKPVITVDLTVIGIEEGTGKNAGRLGALVCEGVDDGRTITVNCGSGFTDAQRNDLWDNRDEVMGRLVEVMADVVSQNQDGTHSLRFPRFVRFRDTLTGDKE